MAEPCDPRDSESSWVLPGSEVAATGLPVDTVGPELDCVTHEAEEEEEEEGTRDTGTAAAAASPGQTPLAAGGEPGGAEQRRDAEAATVPDGSVEPSVPDGGEQPDGEAEPDPHPDSPDTGAATEEGSRTSSDEDVEGLRRRRGREPLPRPPPAPPRGLPAAGGEDGLSTSTCLLGALALVAVGLLAISGGIYEAGDGPAERAASQGAAAGERESLLPTDSDDSQQKPLPPDAGDARSVPAVSLLLDKLAKENQEIRLMQAELQAHKEELQALLRKSEGKAAAAGVQQESLTAENAQLRAALEQEATALRDARAELQRLRAAGAAGSPGAGEPTAERPPGAGTASHGEDATRPEGARRRGWLASLQQELAGALARARGPGGLEGLVEELSALERRLGRELEAAAAEPFPVPRQKPFKAEKESKRRKRHGAREAPHEREGSVPRGHSKEPRPPQEHKPAKTWGKPSGGPPRHGPREPPPLGRYRAPQGCSGVADCACKEGREVLGVALEPVQKAEFLRLLEAFMGRLGWGAHFGGLAARLDGAFGADGAFAHDRLRFVDFVDDVEELLEEVARRERGDEEAADGFEEYVLRHYAGDGSAAGKERGRRTTWRRGTRG